MKSLKDLLVRTKYKRFRDIFHTGRDCAACHPLHVLYVVVTLFFTVMENEFATKKRTITDNTNISFPYSAHDQRNCGYVDTCVHIDLCTCDLWTCATVAFWGPMDLCKCGHVGMWSFGSVGMWTLGGVDVWA